MSSVIIINNPTARSSSAAKLDVAVGFFRARGFGAEVLVTRAPGDAEDLARKASQENPAFVVAAGGDGTVNEVMNGLAGTGVPVAILPLGTVNVLARELSIPFEVEGALMAAISRKPRRASLGRIRLLEPHGGGHDAVAGTAARTARYFCLMAGIGFDGKAVCGVNQTIKAVSGKAAYVLSGLRTFVRYNPGRLVFSVDGREIVGTSGIIGKSSRYGGDFHVTPGASLFDHRLQACIFQGSRRSDLLRYVLGVVRGTHGKADDIVLCEAHRVVVSGEASVQIDGDCLGKTPAEISVERDTITVVA